MPHSIVIVIEDVPGNVTAGTIRDAAQALAFRLGGRLEVAHPITEIEPPRVMDALRRNWSAIQTRLNLNAAARRTTQE